MRVLAVDFGTSTTVAAVSEDGKPSRLVTLDGSPLMPSAVYLTDSGTLAIGRDADRQARVDPSRYEPNPKRRIDDAEIVLGVAALPVTEVIADVLRHVGKAAREQLGGEPDEVRLTHPARWSAQRRNRLLQALSRSGITGASNPKILIPEPVAAASHFAAGATGHTVADGGALAVYDLGAGTFDVAILRKAGASWEVLAEAGLPDLGGLDFDRSIIDHVGQVRGVEHPDEWQSLLEPTDPNSRRMARALAEEVKAGKEALSRASSTDIELPEPFRDLHLTRAEFEELIRPKLARTVDLLATQIERAGLRPDQLAGVYLVGGSSRIPLIASMVQAQTGLIPSTLDQPETSVATGALIATSPADPDARPAAGGSPVASPAGPPVAPTGPVVPTPPVAPAGAVGPVSQPMPAPPVPGQPMPPHPSPLQGSPQPGTPQPASYSQTPPPGQPPTQPPVGPQSGPTPVPTARPITANYPAPIGQPLPMSAQPPGGPSAAGPGRGGPPPRTTGAGNGAASPPSGARRRGPLIAGIAIVVAVAVAVTLILTLGGGSDDPNPQADPTATTTETAEPTSTESPTGSAAPTDAAGTASTANEYDDLLSSDAMVSYLEPAYDSLKSCSKNPDDNGFISCDLGDDRLLIIMDTDTDAYTNDAVPNFLNGSQNSGWTPGSYNKTTWTSPDGDHSGAYVTATYADTGSPIIYWERDGELAAALGIKTGSGTTATPEDLQAMWEDLFNH